MNNENKTETVFRGMVKMIIKDKTGQELENSIVKLLLQINDVRLKEVGFLNMRLAKAIDKNRS